MYLPTISSVALLQIENDKSCKANKRNQHWNATEMNDSAVNTNKGKILHKQLKQNKQLSASKLKTSNLIYVVR